MAAASVGSSFPGLTPLPRDPTAQQLHDHFSTLEQLASSGHLSHKSPEWEASHRLVPAFESRHVSSGELDSVSRKLNACCIKALRERIDALMRGTSVPNPSIPLIQDSEVTVEHLRAGLESTFVAAIAYANHLTQPQETQTLECRHRCVNLLQNYTSIYTSVPEIRDIANRVLDAIALMFNPLEIMLKSKLFHRIEAPWHIPLHTPQFMEAAYKDVQFVNEGLIQAGAIGSVDRIAVGECRFARKKTHRPLDQGRLNREAVVLMHCNHPHIITIAAIAYPDVYLSLANTDLFELVEQGISSDRLSRCFYDICSGLRYLSSLPIIHSDLKATNVLVTDDRCQIADMDLASHPGEGLFCTFSGHIAPELLIPKAADPRADLWSLGAMVLFLAYKHPSKWFQEPSVMAAYHHKQPWTSVAESLPPRGSDLDPQGTLHDIAIACLHGNPDQRPAIEDLMERLTLQEAATT